MLALLQDTCSLPDCWTPSGHRLSHQTAHLTAPPMAPLPQCAQANYPKSLLSSLLFPWGSHWQWTAPLSFHSPSAETRRSSLTLAFQLPGCTVSHPAPPDPVPSGCSGPSSCLRLHFQHLGPRRRRLPVSPLRLGPWSASSLRLNVASSAHFSLTSFTVFCT